MSLYLYWHMIHYHKTNDNTGSYHVGTCYWHGKQAGNHSGSLAGVFHEEVHDLVCHVPCVSGRLHR